LEEVSFIKGLVIGIIAAAPLGPIGILCLQRTFSQGYFSGLVSGLGLSTADAICSLVAAFGLTGISEFILVHQIWFRLIGGFVVLIPGIKILFSTSPQDTNGSPNNRNHFNAFFSSFFLTLMNPMLIFSFAAFFASFGLIFDRSNYICGLLLVAGVFCGSAFWWIVLSGAASRFKRIFTPKMIQRINQGSGGLIICFGLFIIGGFYFRR
jgi:threonine/homoserine/homoserine lactone efflux protein